MKNEHEECAQNRNKKEFFAETLFKKIMKFETKIEETMKETSEQTMTSKCYWARLK